MPAQLLLIPAFVLENAYWVLVALPCALCVLTLLRRRLVVQPRASALLSVLNGLLLPVAAFALSAAASAQFLKATELSPYRSLAALAIYNGAPLALLVTLATERFRPLAYGLVMGLFALIVAGDLVYFRQFGNIAPLLAAKSGGQIWDVRDMVLDSLSREDLWLVPLALSAVLVPALSFKLPRPSKPWLSLGLQALLLGLSVYLTLPLVRDAQAWLQSQRSWRVYNGMDSVRAAGLVAAHLREILRTSREISENQPPTEAQLKALTVQYQKRAQAAEVSEGFGAAKGKNVLVLQLEAMQEFVIGAEIGGQAVTPFLNGLRQRGLYFANIYDQTGESSTSDAEYLNLNSQHPLQQGAVVFRAAENDFVALPHVFARAGYSTMSAHAYVRGMWNRAFIHPRWGFQKSLFKEEVGAGTVYGWGVADHVFFDRMLPVLGAQPKPWFAFLVTLTSHGPYNYLPAEERKLKLGALSGTQLGNYLQSMNYLDRCIERLFKGLEQRGMLDTSMLAIYGDHDSRMRLKPREVKGAVSELGMSRARADRLKRRDFSTDRIPLFIVLPKSAGVAAGPVATFGGQIDTAPTLLHLAGLGRPRSFMGKTLYPARSGSVVTVKGAAGSPDALWIPERKVCEAPDTFDRLQAEACAALKVQVNEELAMSWQLTMKNLAQRIAGLPAASR